MGQRRIGQGSLAEALLPAGVGANRRLERIAGPIDWVPLARLLAQWYQLSDPGLEEALVDRLSFRRFRGLLAERGLAEALFAELNRQLDAQGLVLKACQC